VHATCPVRFIFHLFLKVVYKQYGFQICSVCLFLQTHVVWSLFGKKTLFSTLFPNTFSLLLIVRPSFTPVQQTGKDIAHILLVYRQSTFSELQMIGRIDNAVIPLIIPIGLWQLYNNTTLIILDIVHRQLNSIGLSVPRKKHIMSPLLTQKVKLSVGLWRWYTTY
jgi:hypothetical protein